MEQTLIRIQQEHVATTGFPQRRLQPTDWNARNTTPIEVFAFLIRKEDNHHHDQQTLIRIQQEHVATTGFPQRRLQPTDWNARNTTPIKVFAFLIRKEDNHHHDQQTQQVITSSNTRTNFFDWKPGFVFRTHCVIKDRDCILVLYGGNNIVSKRLVEKLKLKTLKKDPFVTVRGLKEEDKVAKETCRVPVSIGEYYKDEVTCYVINIEKEEEEEDQLLFGGPWLYRVRATHDARKNSCMIIWNQNMILLQPQVQDN